MGLALWGIAELIVYGARLTADGIQWVVVLFLNCCVVLVAAWNLQRRRRWSLLFLGVLPWLPALVDTPRSAQTV
jgi:hypothetical protein